MSDNYRDRILAAMTRNYEKSKKASGEDQKAAWKATGPKRKKGKPSDVPTERKEQVRLAKYLDSLGLLWCHVPNEGHGGRGKGAQIRGASLRTQGLKSGVPDCLVFDSCSLEEDGEVKQYKGCAIELKREKGGRVSESQKRWLIDLKRRGWFTAVCNGFIDAKQLIERLGYAEGSEEGGGCAE